MSGFLSELDTHMKGDSTYVLDSPLHYDSKMIGMVTVPVGFETDLASVPRIPVIYELWGARAHREAVVHDYLCRTDSLPVVSCPDANSVFLEAMKSRGVSWWIRYPMYFGVCLGCWILFHRKRVCDEI